MVGMRDDGPTVRQVVMWIPVGLVALLLVLAIWEGAYTVAAHEQAVVLRFGRYHRTEGPGLHFKIPLVDRVVKVEINERSMRLPFGTSGTSQEWEMTPAQSGMQEQLLILTGDLYAGVVEWNVIWRVAEPKRFLFSLEASQVEQIMTAGGAGRDAPHRRGLFGGRAADRSPRGDRAGRSRGDAAGLGRLRMRGGCGRGADAACDAPRACQARV